MSSIYSYLTSIINVKIELKIELTENPHNLIKYILETVQPPNR